MRRLKYEKILLFFLFNLFDDNNNGEYLSIFICNKYEIRYDDLSIIKQYEENTVRPM